MSDGLLSLEEVINAHESLGFDFLAITDHNRRTVPISYVTKGGLVVISGIELTPDKTTGMHVIELKSDKCAFRFLAHPSRYKLTPGEINQVVVEDKYKLDGFELSDHGLIPIRYMDAYRFEMFVRPVLITSDVHSSRNIGDSFIVVNAKEKSADAILRALKRNKIHLTGPEYYRQVISYYYPKAKGGYK